MNPNIVLSAISLVLFGAIILVLYMRAKHEKSEDPERDKLTFNKLVDIVKNELADLVKDENFAGVSGADYEAAYRRQKRIKRAMQECVYGIDSAKVVVQGLIKNIIFELCETDDDLLEVVDFYADFLEPRIKFEILLYFYKKEHGKDALEMMIREYDLDRERYEIEDKTQPTYLMTSDDIDMIYKQKNFVLDRNVMLDIITVLIYQRYKGFGIIDTLREMNIDGFSAGVSGSILSGLLNTSKLGSNLAPRSIWLHYKGKQIHLRFLTFGTEDELRRIAQLIGRYGKSQPLTEAIGFKVSSMYDKSRVLTLRPPAAEYWCFVVRKFVLKEVTLRFLLDPKDLKTGTSLVKNPELPEELIKHSMRGQMSTIVSGVQGTGKTTNMMAWVKHIDPRLTLRILEMTFELYLREIYTERNIISVQETAQILLQNLQDALKKSDGNVTLLGEIATDPIAARFVQNSQISSPFQIASHHGMTPSGVVNGLSNSMFACGASNNLETAKRQVVQAVMLNAHLAKTLGGVRYFDHFTEIIPRLEDSPYPELPKTADSLNEIMLAYAKVQRDFAIRQTTPELFSANTILKFDINEMKYIPVNPFSNERIEHMLERMSRDQRGEFATFMEKYFYTDKKVA